MCRKLIFLATFVLVLSIVGSASAELVAHWRFDEGSGSETRQGGGTPEIPASGQRARVSGAQWVEGRSGHALFLSGGQGIRLPGTAGSAKSGGSGTVEIVARFEHRERRDVVRALGVEPQALARGRDHRNAGAVGNDFVDECGNTIEEVLAVVEHEHDPTPDQRIDDGL